MGILGPECKAAPERDPPSDALQHFDISILISCGSGIPIGADRDPIETFIYCAKSKPYSALAPGSHQSAGSHTWRLLRKWNENGRYGKSGRSPPR
jgi:hypothetical protein